MKRRKRTLLAAVQGVLRDRHTLQPLPHDSARRAVEFTLRRGDFACAVVEAVGILSLLFREACADPSWPRSLVRDTIEAALVLAEECGCGYMWLPPGPDNAPHVSTNCV